MSDSEKSVPESSLAKKPRRGWWRRVGWKMAAVLVLLAAGFYYEEKVRGRRALEREVADYEAAGESLKVENFLTKAPLADWNFGTTPLLDGMMTAEETDDPREAVTNKELMRFCELCPWPYRDSLVDPDALANLQRAMAQQPHGNTSGKNIESYVKSFGIDWREVRNVMFERGSSKPAKEEPSDVLAVDQALERERALFDELASAARRHYSVFTPAPADRGEYREGCGYFALNRLPRVIRLRILTAITLGRYQEAANLTKVFWKLREGRVAEGGLYHLWMAARLENQWNACVFDMVRAPGVDDGILSQLQMQVPPAWTPEKELLQAARGAVAFTYVFWKKLIDAAEFGFTGDLYGAFRERFSDRTNWVLYAPSGWLSLAAATNLKRRYLYQVNALKALDFGMLPHVQKATWADEPSLVDCGPWYPGVPGDSTLQFSVTPLIRIRLTLLVLGMERYRLHHGRYPARAAVLVPDFLKGVPKDMDGRPLRVATSEDGARSVVYSIGWNMVDDWHGDVPEKFAGGLERDADLAVSLPFPALPRP